MDMPMRSFLLVCLAALVMLVSPQVCFAKKEVTPKIGYICRSVLMCRYADHCRDADAGVEEEYMAFLKGFDAIADALTTKSLPSEELQKKLNDFRDGLAAREKLHGPCPARCISYNYPVLLELAQKNICKHKQYDLIIDVPSVYYGLDKIQGGTNLNDEVFAEVQRLRLIPPT
jgi:hypothetical protein